MSVTICTFLHLHMDPRYDELNYTSGGTSMQFKCRKWNRTE